MTELLANRVNLTNASAGLAQPYIELEAPRRADGDQIEMGEPITRAPISAMRQRLVLVSIVTVRS